MAEGIANETIIDRTEGRVNNFRQEKYLSL